MTDAKKPSPQAPKPADRAKDNQRLKHCDDERLSDEAGYGRADSTPNPKN